MPNILPFVRKSLRFHNSARKQNKEYIDDKEAFKPHGVQIFYGEQGSGKTITCIDLFHTVRNNYPKALVVSNVELHDMNKLHWKEKHELVRYLSQGFDTTKNYIFYSSKKEYELVNICVRNGKYGVIMITDEYQNYFSNQDSRNVPPWVIEQAAQNRKQARLHLCTSQDFDQMVSSIRRRSDIAFKCRTYSLPFTYGPIFTVYWAYDSKKLDLKLGKQITAPKPLKIGFYFHSKQLRDSFDTHQVVFTGDDSQIYAYQFNQQINIKTAKPQTTAKHKRK